MEELNYLKQIFSLVLSKLSEFQHLLAFASAARG
jgi:hypothetical protein